MTLLATTGGQLANLCIVGEVGKLWGLDCVWGGGLGDGAWQGG